MATTHTKQLNKVTHSTIMTLIISIVQPFLSTNEQIPAAMALPIKPPTVRLQYQHPVS